MYLSQSDYVAIGAFAVFFVVFFFALAVPQIVLGYICGWKTFEKAGQAGWKSLIPGYGAFISFKIFWNVGWFFAYIATAVVSSVISAIPAYTMEGEAVVAIMSVIVSIFAIVLNIMYTVKITHSFGRRGGFTAGMIFLPLVFYSILALGPDKYIGPGGVSREIPENPQLPGSDNSGSNDGNYGNYY